MGDNIFRTFLRGRNSKTAIIIVSVAAVVIAIGLVYRLFFYHAENNNFTKSNDNTKSFNEITVGEHYIFGTYEQDNDESNGAEDIEWRVLALEDGKALLITEKLIDCKPYHETFTNVTWETCTLRAWLNDDFLHEAFSDKEQHKIATVTNQNPDRYEHDENGYEFHTDGGNDTQDKIFVLNLDEAEQYFSSDQDRLSVATPYAKAKGAYTLPPREGSCWWLRSPGDNGWSTAEVEYSGVVNVYGLNVYDDKVAIRPALWLEL